MCNERVAVGLCVQGTCHWQIYLKYCTAIDRVDRMSLNKNACRILGLYAACGVAWPSLVPTFQVNEGAPEDGRLGHQ